METASTQGQVLMATQAKDSSISEQLKLLETHVQSLSTFVSSIGDVANRLGGKATNPSGILLDKSPIATSVKEHINQISVSLARTKTALEFEINRLKSHI